MKIPRILFYITLILIVIGCFLPIYQIDDINEKCGIFTIIALIFNCVLIVYIYIKHKYYINLILFPQIISLIIFILIWNDIADKFILMNSRGITNKYCIGFYFLLVGIFLNLVLYITHIRKEMPKKIIPKVKYVANKETGMIKRIEK